MLTSPGVPDSYLEGQIVLKIKPEYRRLCGHDYIDLPALQQLLLPLQNTQVGRKFPKEKPLVIKRPELQKNFTDISLIYKLRYTGGPDPLQLALALSRLPEVAYAEPEWVYTPFAEYRPNDPMANSQALLAQIKAYDAWAYQKGDSTIIIGFVDTSFMWDHPDLQDNLQLNTGEIPDDGQDNDEDGYVDNYRGWDFVGGNYSSLTPDADTRPRLGSGQPASIGHGTMVAGYASSRTDNQRGIAGTSFNCRFMPLKCSIDALQGGSAGIVYGYDAIQYAASHGAHVVNCSWGGKGFSKYGEDIIKYATYNKGCLVVAAGGNELSNSIYYPAGYEGVLGVAACNGQDRIATTWGSHIDVVAPGTGPTTTQEKTYWSDGVPYSSFSSPVAAGCAALLKSQHPELTPVQLVQLLRMGADDIYAINTDPKYANALGAGRINLYKSVTYNGPAITCQELDISEGNADGKYKPGEKLTLHLDLVNSLFPAGNLLVSVQTTDPHITLDNNSQLLGSIVTNEHKYTTLSLWVGANTPADHVATLTFQYRDGIYLNTQNVEIVLNNSNLVVNSYKLKSTLNASGNWAAGGAANIQNSGTGLSYLNENYATNTGLYIHHAGYNYTLHNMYLASGTAQALQPIGLPAQLQAGQQYSQHVRQQLQTPVLDNLNLQIEQNLYGFDEMSAGGVIIHRYKVKNPAAYHQSGINFGLFANWGVSTYLTVDSGYYKPDQQLLILKGTSSKDLQKVYLGIVLLENSGRQSPTAQTAAAYQVDQAEEIPTLLKLSEQTVALQSRNMTQVMGVRDLLIAAKDSAYVGYAVLAANSEAELTSLAAEALRKYECMFFAPALAIQQPLSYQGCGTATASLASHTNAKSVLWLNDQSTTMNHPFATSGTYTARLFTQAECWLDVPVQIQVLQTPQPDVVLNDTLLTLPNATLHFQEVLGYNCVWSMGDGMGWVGSTGQYTYRQPGTYTVTLLADNGSCDTQRTFTINVVDAESTPTQRTSASAQQLKVWPIPAQDMLHLELPSAPAMLYIDDIQGRRLLVEKAASTQHSITLALSPGVYMLTVVADGIVEKKKIYIDR